MGAASLIHGCLGCVGNGVVGEGVGEGVGLCADRCIDRRAYMCTDTQIDLTGAGAVAAAVAAAVADAVADAGVHTVAAAVAARCRLAYFATGSVID